MINKKSIQKFGGFLSGMVMPAIPAFIAWGFITALFIPGGWWPNENLAQLVDPMIKYLLPLLIAYNGGDIIYGKRGGIVGATATMGAIVGSEVPMFLGAMIVGPISALLIKKVDDVLVPRTKAGFEMLVNNFSAGILALILSIIAFSLVGPLVEMGTNIMGMGVQFLVDNGVLFLTSILVEPAKILFLNNAINHSIFTPLGMAEAAESGKSIYFLIEANPGPGLGLLLAVFVFGKGQAKYSAPGAAVIHFFGGIHEIYFPYALMKPKLILALILGGMAGVATFSLLDAGLVAAASPGSIIAITAMAPKGGLLAVYAGVFVSTVVTFVVAGLLLKLDKDDEFDIEGATAKVSEMKGKESHAERIANSKKSDEEKDVKIEKDEVIVYFACDAGMGSSAMGASLLRKKASALNIEVLNIKNCAIKNLPSNVDVVFTQESLTDVAKKYAPDAQHISVDKFLGAPEYDNFVNIYKK